MAEVEAPSTTEVELSSVQQRANRHRSAHTGGAGAQSATSILLKRWWMVLGGAVLVAIITFALSEAVPATYSSQSKVALLVSGTDINDTTLGADNLASQYAQMVSATPVLLAASKLLRRSDAIPSSAISAGSVGAENLIAIQATADSAALAQARAAAVTGAFINYISTQVDSQASSYQRTSTAQLRPLNAQIAQTQAALDSAPPASTPKSLALEETLNALIAQRAAALSSIAQTAVAGRPTATLVSDAGAGSKTAPRPALYALVAFIVGLLVIARSVVYFSVHRQTA